jgi:UDP-N-acetylmuramate: L-alanyl-gamma-D-glutamyl-meso-diaminopimelate ligase
VVLCGTHGKTTTTALTAWILDHCGLEPGYFVGGQPLDFPNSARLCPPGHPFVVEGDEYDTAFFDKRAKFFHYLPRIAVVTSVEFDHGDIYTDLNEIIRAFRLMMRQIPASGWALLCADNPGARDLRPHAPCRTALYGFAEDAEWRGIRTGAREGYQLLDLYHDGTLFGSFEIPLAGRHNLQNSIAALAVGAILGASAEALREAIRAFKGVRRRMEVFHEANGIVFVDDFAHHPTAIRETVAAARMRWPERRLVTLFEPRSNTTVTRAFQAPLCDALTGTDVALIGPIHRAERIPQEERLDREELCRTLNEKGVSAQAFDSTDAVFDWVSANGREGDLMLFMSNGAFGGIYAKVRER